MICLLPGDWFYFFGSIPDRGLIKLETPEHKHAQRKAWGSFSEVVRPSQAVLSNDFWDSKRTEVNLEDLSSLVPKTPLLCFWTSTATIELQTLGMKKNFKTRIVGTVCLRFLISIPPGEVKTLELIVLGDQPYLQHDGTPAVAVVAIRWERGIAYREPFGLETIAYHD